VQADLEKAIWGGTNGTNPQNPGISTEFVTAFLKGGSNGFALKHADATVGTLTTLYDGPRPRDFQPMQKQVGVASAPMLSPSNSASAQLPLFCSFFLQFGFSPCLPPCCCCAYDKRLIIE
jgi:hypothetical protein